MGTAKWFDPTKGYGFIKPDDGGPDVFVHVSADYTNLAAGARISYELKAGRSGKTSAENTNRRDALREIRGFQLRAQAFVRRLASAA